MKRLILLIFLSLALAIALPGCRRKPVVNGRSPQPVYELPAELEFTPEERDVVLNLMKVHPEIWKKVQGHVKHLRAILKVHNGQALAHNLAILRDAGMSDTEIMMLRGRLSVEEVEPEKVQKEDAKPEEQF